MNEHSKQIINNAIERHNKLLTDFMILDDVDQKRVENLIEKIKKNR